MNRRGFLSILGIGGTGLIVPKWMVYEPAKLTATDVSAVNLQAITLATATELERALKFYKYAVASDWKDEYGIVRRPEAGNSQIFDLIGSERRPRVMRHRPMADFSLPRGREVTWHRAYAKPGAEALAEQIKSSGVDYFACPKQSGFANESVVVKAPGGLYVRGYINRMGGDLRSDDMIAFDLIGAA